MQTYSHFLITAALRKPLQGYVKDKKIPPVRTSALFLGSIMPDLLLILISIVCIVIDLLSGLSFGSEAFRDQSVTFKLFDDWFFNNPWVIAAQNLFHSPLLVAVFIAGSYGLWRRNIRGMGWFFWLSCASMLHTVIDIFVHYDDGPLLLFPLNWNLRFQSPVSYWDSEHYGVQFAIFEHSLDLALIIFFIVLFVRGRINKRKAAS